MYRKKKPLEENVSPPKEERRTLQGLIGGLGAPSAAFDGMGELQQTDIDRDAEHIINRKASINRINDVGLDF